MRRDKKISGYSRGDETRARIVDEAVRLFGLKGFESTSTREIAAAAAVPAPSLRYYFTSKDGLYAACWNHVQDKLLAVMEPALQHSERLLAGGDAEKMHLIDAFCGMQEVLIDHTIGGGNSVAETMFSARLDLPSGGGEREMTGEGAVAYRMVTCFTRLVMEISGNTLDWQAALVVAGLINGQHAAIVAKRKRLTDVGIDFVGERLQWLKRTIRQQTAAILMLHSG